MVDGYLTTGEIARELGVNHWRVRRAVDRLPNVQRIGTYRLIHRNRLHEVEQALGSMEARR